MWRLGKVRVGDIDIHYEIHGSGEPLVLIEGLGYAAWMWFKQVPELSKHFQVIIFDNRGVGNTDKPDMEYSIKMFADDTAGLLKALGIPRAHILGVSMGGFIAQEFALAYPEMAKKLILCSTSFGGPHMIPIPQRTLQIMAQGGQTAEETFRIGLSVAVGGDYLQKKADEMEMIIGWRLANIQPRYAYMRQFHAGAGFDAEERVGRIMAPTLVMAGEDDQVVPAENARLLAEKIAGARLELFPGAGHLFFIEKAAEFNRKVLDFLR